MRLRAASRGDGARDRFRAERKRAGIARNEYLEAQGAFSAAATSSSNRSAVTLPYSSPSIITAGEHAQLPRQYTGSSVKAPSRWSA